MDAVKRQTELNLQLRHSGLEEAVHVAHLHNHSLQLGVVLDGHLSIFSAKAWWNTEETNVNEAHQSEWIVSESEAE